GGAGICRYLSEGLLRGGVAADMRRLATRPAWLRGIGLTLQPQCRQRSARRGRGFLRSVWPAGTLLLGCRALPHGQRAPRTDAFALTSPCGRSVGAGPADCRVPLSSHPCLPLPHGIPTGPGPSLPARFAARRSPVLQPDPSSGCHPSHFPLTVIGQASAASFLRRTPRTSPVALSPFAPRRR